MFEWRPKIEQILVAVAVGTFVVQAALWWQWTIDDSYISYRYAANLAAGHGLVFNHGEWVEGYSNPMWVLILSVPALIGIPPDVVAKPLGLAAGIGSMLYVRSLLRELGVHWLTVVCAMAWLGTSVALILYSISGMETILFALGITGLASHIVRREWWWAALWTAIASLTRPEGVIYVAPLVFGLLIDERPWSLLEIRRRILPLLVPLGALVGWGLARWFMYGTLVPNTFHAKNFQKQPILERIWHNLPIAWEVVEGSVGSLFSGGIAIAPAILGAVLLLGKRRAWPVLAVPLCGFFFLTVSGRDWMSLSRFLIPIVPVLGVLIFIALDRLRALNTRLTTIAVLVLTIAMVGQHVRLRQKVAVDLPKGKGHNPAMDSRGHVALAHRLAKLIEPGDDGIMLNEIGAVGYYSGGRVLDTIGLIHKDVPLLLKQGVSSDVYRFFSEYPKVVALHDHRSRGRKEMYYRDQRYLAWMELSGLYEEIEKAPLADWRAYRIWHRVGPRPEPGQGLMGRYETPEGVKERVDGMVHFDWRRGAPHEGMPVDNFILRWQGCLSLSEPQFVYGQGRDAVKVMMNDEASPPNKLWAAGKYNVTVHYEHRKGDAGVTLVHRGPGEQPTAVPPAWLVPEACPDS